MILQDSHSILTVDDVTEKIREAVYSSKELQNVSVRGELLGFKRHTSGHSYFTILGKDSRIACVLFRSNASSVVLWPKDGDEVLVRGHVDVYGARGSYQIYATTILPLGAGAKARAKELLFAQLTNEGLFDVRHKRPIPRFPDKVAIVTSPTGAALQDVIRIASLRYPASELLVIPSLMQGVGAPSEITDALGRCGKIKGISLVMLVRGGGNRDDLDTFDDEQVVRAVRSCPVPVITGLGHQIDKTLSDMAADAAAPTPSGAAERVFPDSRELYALLNSSMRSVSAHADKIITKKSAEINDVNRRLVFNINRGICDPAVNYIENVNSNMVNNITYRLNEAEAKLASAAGFLHNSSPLAILSKGYAICRSETGGMIKSVSSASVNDDIEIQLRDGFIEARITSVNKDAAFD